jgi:hypothetical protein
MWIFFAKLLYAPYTNVNPFIILFYWVGFNKKPFATCISPGFGVEFVAVQRAHDVSRRINPTLVHIATRMRAFGGTPMRFAIVDADTNFAPTGFYQAGVTIYIPDFRNAFGYFIPGIFFVKHLK